MTDSRRPLAVIIGIADYVLPRLRLATPVRDAEALAAMLADHHGYEIRLVRDREASRQNLLHLLEVELPAVLDATRPVVIYFAGHGTATDSIDEPRGYLVPADGGGDVDSLLSMADLARVLAGLPSRHLLLLLDCCFAGAFRWSAGRDVAAETPPTLYRERYERFLETAAWQVITSTAHDEHAPDVVGGLPVGKRAAEGHTHSPFLQALLRGLRGDADLFPRHADGTTGDGVVTATELYLYLRHQLETADPAPDKSQTPGLWILPRHRKGEYIFYVPATRLALPDAPTLSLKTSPYRGFLLYQERHAQLFHGRRAATAALCRLVEHQPITVVVGSSGTGKSSLVRAGLLPALRQAHPAWQILRPIRPGATPLATLAGVLETRHPGVTVVLVVDQLEELFATPEWTELGAAEHSADRAAERTQFLTQLLALAGAGVRIVGTLRADLEPQLASSPLGPIWDHARFPLADMTQDELREAIETPAAQQGLTFEPPAMVDRLINSVMTMPGALPLLSFTLHKLYVDCLRRAENDRKLIEPHETGAGILSRGLREHIDRIYAGFDDATRDTMRRVLLRMVSVHSGAIVRRRVPLGELEPALPAERARVGIVLDALTGRTEEHDLERTPVAAATGYSVRLAVRGGSRGGGFVELAHDAVARDWPQLAAWLRDAGPRLALQRAVTVCATQWLHDRKHAGYLWRDDPRLPRAERLLATPHQLNQLETAFVVGSLAARRRRGLQKLRTAVLVLLAMSMLVRLTHEDAGEASTLDGMRTAACEHVEATYLRITHELSAPPAVIPAPAPAPWHVTPRPHRALPPHASLR